MTKSRGGAPTKFTKDTQSRLFEALQRGATYELACAYARISYSSFRNWMKQGEKAGEGQFLEFFNQIKQAEACAVMNWLQAIDDAAHKGHWQAAAWKLERRYPLEYGRTIQEHSGKNGSSSQSEIVKIYIPDNGRDV